MTHEPDLIIAFAFSLTPDGAPGSYNVRLAQHLDSLLKAYPSVRPYVGIQWEIADALANTNPGLLRALQRSGKLIVAEPPKFATGEVNEDRLQGWLANTDSHDAKLLRRWLTTTKGQSTTEQLNHLLGEANFYEGFEPLALNNLERPKLGDLFTEHRTLPCARDYPLGLARFQRKRINRLIIERLLEDSDVVQPGQYLSTAGVIDFIADQLVEQLPTNLHKTGINTVGIVAHPLHAPRCIQQTKSTIAARNIRAEIYGEGPDGVMPWDRATAQHWCRSLANWSTYEKTVQTRTHQRPPTL